MLLPTTYTITARLSYATAFYLLVGSNNLLDVLENVGVLERRGVTERVVARRNLAEKTTHDLARAGLGDRGDNVDLAGGGEGADNLADLDGELLGQLGEGLAAVVGALHDNKGNDGLASKVVRDTDNGGLADTRVHDERTLNLGGGETVACGAG